MDIETKNWIAGLLVAIVVGHIVTGIFLYTVRGVLGFGSKPKDKTTKRVPPWLTGCVERLVFAVFVGLDISGTAPAMIGWLAIKMATNWNRKDMETVTASRPFSFSALLAGLISMLFAVLGGMICSGKLWSAYVSSI